MSEPPPDPGPGPEPAPRPEPGSWDPGMQSERTGLAWQRTLLSGLACSLLVARLLAGVSIPLAFGVGLLAVLGTAGLGWGAVSRFRRHDLAIRSGAPIGGAAPYAVLSALVAVTALAALLYVAAV